MVSGVREHKDSVHTLFAGLVILVTCLCVLLPSCPARAFDGQRQGFMLGGGLGVGYATIDYEYYREKAETVGIQSTFIIGGGISNQVTLSYTGLQFWGNFGSDDVEFALLPSAEVRYFTAPEGPSWFGALGFGLSLHNDRYDEWGLGGGLAPHIGIGREFTPHISVEFNTVYALAPSDTDDPLINVMFLVTALAY